MMTVATHTLACGVGAPAKGPAGGIRAAIRPASRSFLPGRIDGTGLAHLGRSLQLPAARVHVRAEGRHAMLDVLYIGLALGFLALSWGLVELCDRL